MIKKILKWIGIVAGVVVLLVIIAGVVAMLVIDKEMIAGQMQTALNRQVTIGGINVNIFSVVSGIEVNDVKISNFKTPKQLETLKGKPVATNDVFVGLKSFNFKLKFMPLLTGKVELRELVLYEPVINVTRYTSGLFNFSDLIAPKKMTPEEKAELLKKQQEEARKKAEEAAKPAKPFTADDLPVEITIGKIGVEKGKLTFVDQGAKQTVQAYNLTALVHSIEIDPKNLAKKDSVKLKIETGLKTIGQVTTGSVKSFDIGVSVNGSVKPFDVKTKKLDPEASVRVGSSYGSMTGLQIFDKMKSVESLEKYCGKFDFLKDEIKWKDAFVNVWYKGGTAKLTDGKIKTADYLLTFSGMTNINTKAVGMDIDMLLAEKHNAAIKGGSGRNVEKGIKAANLEKYVKADRVTDIAMKQLANKDGNVYLQYKVTGTMDTPKTELVKPKLPTIGELVREAAGDVKDVAKEAAQKTIDRQSKKAEQKVEKKLKKLF